MSPSLPPAAPTPPPQSQLQQPSPHQQQRQQQQQAPPASSSNTLTLTPVDQQLLRDAVESLYRDEIQPTSDDLHRRLKERGASDMILSNFLLCYEALPGYRVIRDPRGGQHSVELDPPPAWSKGWVDAKSPDDPYDTSLWQALSSYLCQLMLTGTYHAVRLTEGQAAAAAAFPHTMGPPGLRPYQFKGGRYGMAKELKQHGPACLNDLSLGRVCHIVQLAIAKGLLAYENNILQPIGACKGKIGASFAVLGGNLEELEEAEGGVPFVTDISAARRYVHSLLLDNPRGLLLSQLKKRLVGRFRVSLCPSVFQFSKLRNLLGSTAFSDLCRLFVDPHNHLVVQSVRFPPLPDTKILEPPKLVDEESYQKTRLLFEAPPQLNILYLSWHAQASYRYFVSRLPPGVSEEDAPPFQYPPRVPIIYAPFLVPLTRRELRDLNIGGGRVSPATDQDAATGRTASSVGGDSHHSSTRAPASSAVAMMTPPMSNEPFDTMGTSPPSLPHKGAPPTSLPAMVDPPTPPIHPVGRLPFVGPHQLSLHQQQGLTPKHSTVPLSLLPSSTDGPAGGVTGRSEGHTSYQSGGSANGPTTTSLMFGGPCGNVTGCAAMDGSSPTARVRGTALTLRRSHSEGSIASLSTAEGPEGTTGTFGPIAGGDTEGTTAAAVAALPNRRESVEFDEGALALPTFVHHAAMRLSLPLRPQVSEPGHSRLERIKQGHVGFGVIGQPRMQDARREGPSAVPECEATGFQSADAALDMQSTAQEEQEGGAAPRHPETPTEGGGR